MEGVMSTDPLGEANKVINGGAGGMTDTTKSRRKIVIEKQRNIKNFL
jgi:hypothetical protein